MQLGKLSIESPRLVANLLGTQLSCFKNLWDTRGGKVETYHKLVETLTQEQILLRREPLEASPQLRETMENWSTLHHPVVQTLMQSLFQLAPNQPAG